MNGRPNTITQMQMHKLMTNMKMEKKLRMQMQTNSLTHTELKMQAFACLGDRQDYAWPRYTWSTTRGTPNTLHVCWQMH